MYRLLDEGWKPCEIQALREAIHNNHTEFIDGQDCCNIEPELEVCPAHSLLSNLEQLQRMLWIRRLYRHWVRTNRHLVERRYSYTGGGSGALIQ